MLDAYLHTLSEKPGKPCRICRAVCRWIGYAFGIFGAACLAGVAFGALMFTLIKTIKTMEALFGL